MEKVESKAVAYAGASLGEIAEAEAKEWITAQVKGWFDEKKNGLKDELLPDISFVGACSTPSHSMSNWRSNNEDEGHRRRIDE